MAVQKVLQLGDPKLYEACAAVAADEIPALRPAIQDLHDTLLAFRAQYGDGRAIAAPQIGLMKRMVYMNIPASPPARPAREGVSPEIAQSVGGSAVFLNPRLTGLSTEMIEVWDDCMCFPDLLVRVLRHKACRIEYRDLNWAEQSMALEGDLSELLQHEVDHLEGILALMRAVDGRSFALRSQRQGAREPRSTDANGP